MKMFETEKHYWCPSLNRENETKILYNYLIQIALVQIENIPKYQMIDLQTN